MEPANLKPDSPDDAPIDAWLRAHSATAPLPDDGFSERVLAALPPAAPVPRPAPAWGGWLYAAAALLGLWMASGSFGGTGLALRDQFADLLPQFQAAATPLAEPGVLLGLAVAAVSLAFVYRREIIVKLLLR